MDKHRIAAGVLLLAFLGIRVAGFLNEPRLEDHDSTSYLLEIAAYGSLDLERISSTVIAVSLPLYPMTAGLLTAAGTAPEFAGRMISLTASLAMAVVIVVMAARLGSWPAGAAAAMFVAFEPTMARLSYGVLTEPLYAALVAAGLWLMLRSVRSKPGMANAAGLGLIFGASFLCRLEGILFLAAVPLVRWCAAAVQRPGMRDQLKFLIGWTAVFVAIFVTLAVPQVWHVSNQMNRFALNGRQAWSIVLGARFAETEEQRLHGLDYDPSVVNIDYLMKSPTELAKLEGSINLKTRAEVVAKNLDELQRQSLPNLLSLFALVFVPIGLLRLLRNDQGTEAFVLVSFAAVTFTAPLMHNTVPRHILAAVPPLVILAALGLVSAGAELARLSNAPRWSRWSLPGVFSTVLLAVLASTVWPLNVLVAHPDRINPLADPARYAPFVPELTRLCGSSSHERLITRMEYISLLAGCRAVPMPYASLRQLRTYAAANNATLMYVDSDSDSLRPFFGELTGPHVPPEGFELLANKQRSDGRQQFLYRLRPAGVVQPQPDGTDVTP